MNGSIYLRGNEEIRQICNGTMDIIDNYVQDFVKQRCSNNNCGCEGDC